MINSSRRYQRYFQNLGQLYQQKKIRFYTEIIATLGTIIFFLLFAIKPTIITITHLLKEIDDKKLVEAGLDQKIKTLMEAQKIYVNLETSLPLLNEALPSEPRLSLYLQQLETLAQKNELQLTALQTCRLVLKDTPQPNQDYFSLIFTLKGSYLQLRTFLDELYRLRRLTEITTFAFKSDRQNPEAVNLTLMAKVYIFEPTNGTR
jgi:Tfp pilus assembly protein PilO